MGSKTRLGSYCTKRANNGVNLVTSRKINTRLARPIMSSGSFMDRHTATRPAMPLVRREESEKAMYMYTWSSYFSMLLIYKTIWVNIYLL